MNPVINDTCRFSGDTINGYDGGRGFSYYFLISTKRCRALAMPAWISDLQTDEKQGT